MTLPFDPATLLLTPPGHLSPQEFMDRFPAAVLRFLTAMQITEGPAGDAVRAELLRFTVVKSVDPTDARTVAGTEGMLLLAAWANVITSDEVAGIAGAILSPAPIRPSLFPVLPIPVIG
jgi:hypothetical protein